MEKINIEEKNHLLSELKSMIDTINTIDKTFGINIDNFALIYLKLSKIEDKELFINIYNEFLKIILDLFINLENTSLYIDKKENILNEELNKINIDKELEDISNKLDNFNF
ncbi:hypothetical protein H3C61_02655 [Candidatus Gracilibacteria bacterium]|nr:hypothetical protein [Candidatus Gracilibacteria bacterium]